MSDEIKIEQPVILNKRVAELITYHFKTEKIVYKISDDEFETSYMIKSIKRDSQTYIVVYNKKFNTWTCDCPAFKFRRRLKQDECKHIQFIKILIAEKVHIESI